MKMKHLFLRAVRIAALGLILAGRMMAQTFTTLHSFTAQVPYFTNSDGVFYNNTDGANPDADLIISGNTLYGTAYGGGNANAGTVFKVNTDGTGFTILHKFTERSGSNRINSDGDRPAAVLVLSGNTLYGTAGGGGSSGKGAVFAVNTDGTGFTNLHSFTALDPVAGTNSDGVSPWGGLTLSDNTLYGTASGGGSTGNGTVFSLDIDGSGFTNLHSFTAAPGPNYVNSDGRDPEARLVLSGNTLYGTAVAGGTANHGTVFALNSDGTGFTTLHNFTRGSDGGIPYAALVLSGNTLYGTVAYGGGISGSDSGTVFKLNTDGAGFAILHHFTATIVAGANSDGANPVAGLCLSGNTLYGTAQQGSISGSGTVFSLSLPRPQLTIIRSGADVILTWPANAAGFTLQSAPAITGTFTNLPAATNAYTNSIAGSQQFFRLISNE
jgi:uncharacterized repeat protein (TIGR03803 family)